MLFLEKKEVQNRVLSKSSLKYHQAKSMLYVKGEIWLLKAAFTWIYMDIDSVSCLQSWIVFPLSMSVFPFRSLSWSMLNCLYWELNVGLTEQLLSKCSILLSLCYFLLLVLLFCFLLQGQQTQNKKFSVLGIYPGSDLKKDELEQLVIKLILDHVLVRTLFFYFDFLKLLSYFTNISEQELNTSATN